MNAFATTFPDGCPPNDAQDANGEFYRLARHDPVQEEDLKTYSELGRRPDGDACLRCGVSVHASLEGAIETFRYLQRRHPHVDIGPHVVRLVLAPEHGKIKQTNKPPHHTWWPYHEVERLSLCQDVKDARDASEN